MYFRLQLTRQEKDLLEEIDIKLRLLQDFEQTTTLCVGSKNYATNINIDYFNYCAYVCENDVVTTTLLGRLIRKLNIFIKKRKKHEKKDITKYVKCDVMHIGKRLI